MKAFVLHTTCVGSTAEAINAMVDAAREVTFATIRKHCDLSNFDDIYAGCPGLSLGSDYSVSFYKSRYKGQVCYFVDHSDIEHVYLREVSA
jgi:hypothetical protein